MEIQDQQDLQAQEAQDHQQEMDQAVVVQEAPLDQAVQEAAKETLVDQAQEGIQAVLQMITQEEVIPATVEEETLLAIAAQEGVKIQVGLIARVITVIRQIQITLLGMEIAAMVIRQEEKKVIQEAKQKKIQTIQKMRKVRMKSLTKSLKKNLKKKKKKKK